MHSPCTVGVTDAREVQITYSMCEGWDLLKATVVGDQQDFLETAE